jgi:hypothetical protein
MSLVLVGDSRGVAVRSQWTLTWYMYYIDELDVIYSIQVIVVHITTDYPFCMYTGFSSITEVQAHYMRSAGLILSGSCQHVFVYTCTVGDS